MRRRRSPRREDRTAGRGPGRVPHHAGLPLLDLSSRQGRVVEGAVELRAVVVPQAEATTFSGGLASVKKDRSTCWLQKEGRAPWVARFVRTHSKASFHCGSVGVSVAGMQPVTCVWAV